jgi:hypothetical protein
MAPIIPQGRMLPGWRRVDNQEEATITNAASTNTRNGTANDENS